MTMGVGGDGGIGGAFGTALLSTKVMIRQAFEYVDNHFVMLVEADFNLIKAGIDIHNGFMLSLRCRLRQAEPA